MINMNTVYTYQNLKKEFPREVLMQLLLEDNYTYRELQEKFNYNERLWSKLAKEYDIFKVYKNISKHLKRFNVEEVIHMKYLYTEEGMSLRQIAKLYNSQHSVIKKYLLELKTEIRSEYDLSYYSHRKPWKIAEEYIDNDGYVRKSDTRQHRVIMESYIGRKLNPKEHVHHIDFNKTNNDISNLFLFDSEEVHSSYHGYLRGHKYISPDAFVKEIYPKIQFYKTKDFLYEQYVLLNKSIAQINREIENYVSRLVLSNLLKQYGYFDKDRHINQYS